MPPPGLHYGSRLHSRRAWTQALIMRASGIPSDWQPAGTALRHRCRAWCSGTEYARGGLAATVICAGGRNRELRESCDCVVVGPGLFEAMGEFLHGLGAPRAP